MKPCMEYLELMNAVLDGEAAPVQHEALSAHLAQCPACAALYEDLKALREGSDALVIKAPNSLKASVMSRIAAESKPSNVMAFTSKAKKKNANRWRSWGAMAAVFALVIGVGATQNLFNSGSSAPGAPAPVPSIEIVAVEPAAAEPSAVAQGIADIARSVDNDAAKGSTLTGHYEYSFNHDTTDPLADQVAAEACPSVAPAESVHSGAVSLNIDWMKPMDLVVQRIYGESGYTLETEYIHWLSGRSPYCTFRLLDGETVIDEGTVIYDGLSENGKFYCFSWTWEGQSEEDVLLFRYAVPLDMSYVMWAGDTFDMENYENALKS